MFEFKERKRNVSDKELLDDIQNTAERLGTKHLMAKEYDEHGTYSVTTIRRRFGKWSDALKKIGLEVKTPIYNSNEDLFENLANVWTSLGKQPVYGDLSKDISKFSSGTYENRFGTWNKSLRAFIDYIKTGSYQSSKQTIIKKKNLNTSRTPRNINWRLRAKILIRDNCICKMCGTSPAKDPNIILHVDHIQAWSKGGETIEENLRALCSKCNIGKSDMDINDIRR